MKTHIAGTEVRQPGPARPALFSTADLLVWGIVLGLLAGGFLWRVQLGVGSPSAVAPRVSDTPLPPAAPSATEPAVAPVPLPIVCIDPGHPSEINHGTTVQNGLREVEVVYDVALLLKARLEEQKIAQAVLTRNYRRYTGKIVTNRQRAEIANQAGAVLLLRLHCDTGKGSGYTSYYPDRTGTKDGITGPSPAMRARSQQAAEALHAGMLEVLRDTTPPLRDNGVKGESATYIGRKQGALTGSIYSKVPAVTVEMVFLSHPADARFLGSPAGQDAMADALALGVVRVLDGEVKR
jgi:N-acetylmuramoyl-L-alanine amidase